MKSKSLSIILVTLVFAGSNSFSQEVRKYSNEFLSIGVGGRALAMSSAYTAITNDVQSGYWNPAGLTGVKHNFQFSFMHNVYFANIAKYDYLGLAVPFNAKERKRVLAFSMLRFGVDDIPYTLELVNAAGEIDYDKVSSFSVADYAFLLSYAQELPIKNLTAGLNVKIVYRTAGSFATAWGFGLDAGLQYEIKNFKLGFMASDVTSTFNAWSFDFTDREKEVLVSTGNELPSNSLEITAPRFKFGVAYDLKLGKEKRFNIMPAVEVEMTTDKERNVPIKTKAVSFDTRFGIEASYHDIVFLRGGVGNIQKQTNDDDEEIVTLTPSAGIGLKIKFIWIDYAIVFGNITGVPNSHVISLTLGINKPKK